MMFYIKGDINWCINLYVGYSKTNGVTGWGLLKVDVNDIKEQKCLPLSEHFAL